MDYLTISNLYVIAAVLLFALIITYGNYTHYKSKAELLEMLMEQDSYAVRSEILFLRQQVDNTKANRVETILSESY